MGAKAMAGGEQIRPKDKLASNAQPGWSMPVVRTLRVRVDRVQFSAPRLCVGKKHADDRGTYRKSKEQFINETLEMAKYLNNSL